MGSPFKNLKSNDGFSMIEVLVAVSISMIGTMAVISLITSSQKQTSRLFNKMSIFDLSNEIRAALLKPGTCSKNLKASNFQSGTGTFNSGTIPSSGVPLVNELVNLKNIYGGSVALSEKLVSVGRNISGTTIKVNGISIQNWLKISADEFKADIVVNVESSNGPLAPMKISGLQLITDPLSPTNAKKVILCSLMSGAPGIPALQVKVIKKLGTKVAVATCPVGYLMTGCSGARDKNLRDNGDEKDHGIVGILQTNENECTVKIAAMLDGDQAVAVATCLKF